MSFKVHGTRLLAALVCASVASSLLATTPVAAQEQPPPDSAPPAHALERSQRGQAAIDALGDRLPEVARIHGMSPGRLRQLFRADETLWVDPTLRLYYVEPTIDKHDHEPSSSDGGVEFEAAAPHPLENTFLLESRPGSPRTIYLDFDGETVTGTAWNAPPPGYDGGATIIADAYDTDGDPSFSDSELEDVQDIWRRVAEDYAPFDVNVTTADPGDDAINRSNLGDSQFGTRVVIDGGTPALSCGCGGIAYLSVFGATGSAHDYHQPAWVFQGGVGTPKNIAEAASHEVGHNLGLEHDGLDYGTVPDPENPGEDMPHPDNREYYTGHGVWAPIMGVGYSKPVVQWSKGEYAAPSNTEDDYVTMLSNGLGTIPDDHFAAFDGTATVIGASPTPLSESGIISTVDDVDVFSFTAAEGLTIVQASPAAVSPNLDISLSLHDSTGALISSDDPLSAFSSTDVATGLDAEVTALLDAGSTYYIRVDGVGALTPSDGYSDYGSLGSYGIDVLSGVCSLGDPGEDDDDDTTAHLLLGGSSFSGTRCPGDNDWYLVPGISGATLTATLEATDLGGELDLELLDASLVQQQVAQTSGSTKTLVHTFTSDSDHYLRVYSATDSETRYDLTTSMPVCPPEGPYEQGNGDDFPHQGFVQALTLPGVKDSVSCTGDSNGDIVEVALEAGREFEATIRFPGGNESSIGIWMLDFEVSTWTSLPTTDTSGVGYKTVRFTPSVTGTYEVQVYPFSGAVPYRLTVSQDAVAEDPPTISGISPTTGGPGDSVTITGLGFDTATDVSFFDGAAAGFSVNSDTEVVASVPAEAADGPITIVNSGGSTTSSQSFDFTEPPPNSAPTAVDDAALVTEARSTDIDVLSNDTDPDSDVLTITAATTPTNGGTVDCTVEVFDVCRFTPAVGTTTDSFTYTVSDGNGGGDTATVNVTIEECADLASGLDPTGLVTGESWTACSDPAASAVTATAPTYMAPTGGTVALMTSGEAVLADPPNDDTGTGVGHGSNRSGAYDVSIKRLDLAIPSGANCLSFELVFGSEEYEEFVGQTFNDAFIAELDSTTWSVDLMTGDITAPNNIALDPGGNVVSVNSVFFGDVITDNGTEYDGATPVLLVRTPITEGAHSLYLSIFDAGDDIYDSGAFVDDLQATTEAEGGCTAGAVEVDDPPTVSLTSPTDGSTIRGLVDLAATATDDIGVDQVEFFVDNMSVGLGTPGAGVWSLAWDSSSVGDGRPHVIEAVATDTADQTTSDASTVTVLSATVSPPVPGAECWTDPLGDVFNLTTAQQQAFDASDLGSFCMAVAGGEAHFYARTIAPQDATSWTIDQYLDFLIDADGDGQSDLFVAFYNSGGTLVSDANDMVGGRLCEGTASVVDGWYHAGGYDLACLGLASFDFEFMTSHPYATATDSYYDSTAWVRPSTDQVPVVTLTSPVDGSTARGVVELTATATDDLGVDQVEFFVGAESVGLGTPGAGETWSLTWNSAGVGDGQSHVISAVATDTGAQTFSDASNVTVLSNAVADFDGDGVTDIAVFRPSDGRWYIHGVSGSTKWGVSSDVPVPADYDGDGVTDIAVFRPSDGRWYIHGVSGSTKWGVSSDVPVPADYDGDGVTDIAVFRPSDGRWYIHGVSGSTKWGVSSDVPVPADYDGDGVTDIAVFRPSDGRWYIHGVSGSTKWGVSSDVPVPADYDGDGVTDIAVFRPSDGRWYIHGVSGSTKWGVSSDVPVPADYDGDGVTDIAVFRPSDGRWYIHGVSGSTKWGVSTDIPLTG